MLALPAGRGAVQLAGQPPQRFLQLGPFPLVHRLDPGPVGDPALYHGIRESFQVPAQQVGQIGDDPGQLPP